MNSTATEIEWLIIGYGNPLRHDDGAGAAVVESLSCVVELKHAHLLTVQQLTPELAQPLSTAHHAIFIDAAVDVPAGELRCAPIHELASRDGAIAHCADPACLLWLARQTFGSSPASYLITIGAGDLSVGEGLSPAVRDGVARAVNLVCHMIWKSRET